MERLIIIIFFLFVSCSSTKNLKRDNTKTKTEAIYSGELTIKRASDTLELTIPKIVYKDTTIYKRGRKSTVYLNYDSNGNAKVVSVCDSIEIAKKWFDLEPRLSLDIVQKLAIDLYRFKLSSSPLDPFFPVQRSWVKSSADKIDTDRLVDLLDEIIRSKQLLGTTVDALLVLETLAKRVFELPKN